MNLGQYIKKITIWKKLGDSTLQDKLFGMHFPKSTYK